MDGKIQYLNTDLDLRSSVDLTSLAAVLDLGGVYPMHVTRGEDGLWYAMFETSDSFEEPDPNIAKMLDAIESLGPEHRGIWSACDRREFNIGYDCGHEPWAFNQGLSSEILGRMAAVGATLRLTLYPDKRQTGAESDPGN